MVQVANTCNSIKAGLRGAIDSNQLISRLNEISGADGGASEPAAPRSRWSPRLRFPTQSPAPEAQKDFERHCSAELLRDGGRPAYPPGLLDDVFEKPPDAHADLLRPWADADGRTVFARQLRRWRDFWKWQVDNRELAAAKEDSEELSAAFLEEKRRHFEATGSGEMTRELKFAQTMRRVWEEEEEVVARQRQRVRFREGLVGGGGLGLAKYTEAARARLADQGFTKTCRFHRDPRRQDRWTEWVEYLEFECWWLDYRKKEARQLQVQYDIAREKLLKADVLMDSETPEGIWREGGDEFGCDGNESINNRRKTAIAEFMLEIQVFRSAKSDEGRHQGWVRWALDQEPLIEAELKASMPATEAGLSHVKSRKRGRGLDETEEAPTKKRRSPRFAEKDDSEAASTLDGRGKKKRRRDEDVQIAERETQPVAKRQSHSCDKKATHMNQRSAPPKKRRATGSTAAGSGGGATETTASVLRRSKRRVIRPTRYPDGT